MKIQIGKARNRKLGKNPFGIGKKPKIRQKALKVGKKNENRQKAKLNRQEANVSGHIAPKNRLSP